MISNTNQKKAAFSLELPTQLRMPAGSAFRPEFQGMPKDYWAQTVCEKIICFFIVLFMIGLAALFTFVLTLWTMNTSSTTFGYIWFSLGAAYFVLITIINSFSKPPMPQLTILSRDHQPIISTHSFTQQRIQISQMSVFFKNQ